MENQDNQSPQGFRPTAIDFIVIAVLVSVVLSSLSNLINTEFMTYSEFLNKLRAGAVEEVVIYDSVLQGRLRTKQGKRMFSTNRVTDPGLVKLLEDNKVEFSGAQSNWLNTFFGWLGILLLVSFGFNILAARLKLGQGEGGFPGLLSSMEKNRSEVYAEKNINTTFADVAGVEEAKAELQEVISFLKDPKAYSRLGGRLPKGILLVGAPGTGKTLLARAVAGEAGVAFFSISGSEFVELFVGVGAARVRDLFKKARQKSPCIIFIDELDALGRSRASAGSIGAHDEKEQTLNQLLVELDGFDTSSGVVLLAATNRPEILDEALLRAGRFDRQIAVDRPDKKGREEILKVHVRKVVLAADVDLEQIATMTPGCTGADLANLVNEATLLATRRKAEAVQPTDFENALDRMIAGLERRNRLLTSKERRSVAYHEMGHALVAIISGSTELVQKVSIIPHGIAALGYTVQKPAEDRVLLTRSELTNKLAALLGGRAAELLIVGEATTGAADDLQKATQLARAMVMRYGMDEQLGLLSIAEDTGRFLVPQSDYGIAAPQTIREVDCAVKELLQESFERATQMLQDHREWLERASEKLLLEETLCLVDIMTCKESPKATVLA